MINTNPVTLKHIKFHQSSLSRFFKPPEVLVLMEEAFVLREDVLLLMEEVMVLRESVLVLMEEEMHKGFQLFPDLVHTKLATGTNFNSHCLDYF